jgi:ubiquinone/menaquinone biosynthesis C-methylase UbiE
MKLTAFKYNIISKFYDLFELVTEKYAISKYRSKLTDIIKGKVLEVGAGTGKNFKYYPQGTGLTAIDFSSGMLKKAYKRKIILKLDNIRIEQMDIQNMQYENESYDQVVSTFVFCTVPDPQKGMQEVYRVLKPDGKFILIEHMRRKHMVVNLMLYVMNFFSKILLGTSMVRDTRNTLKKQNFKIIREENLFLDVVKFIIVKK